MPPRKKNGDKTSAELKQKITSSLKNVYAQTSLKEKQTMISPPPSRSKIKILTGLLIFFAFLAAVSWAGFFFFGNSQKFSEDKIEIQINGPEKAPAGQNVAYIIVISNHQKTPLANTSLEVRYPDNFKFASSSPASTDAKNRIWNLGGLDQNQQVKIEINGQIFGETPTDLALRTFFSYRPANFNADFQKITNFTTHLEPVAVDVSFNGPEELTAGEEGAFVLTLLNKQNEPANNLEISLGLPANLKTSALTPAPSTGQNVWKVTTLAPSASTTIKFKVAFNAGAIGGPQSFIASLYLREGAATFLQKTAEKSLNLSQAALALSLAANGSIEKQRINFEDKIPFLLSFENTGQKSLKNVTLRLVIDAPFDGEKSILNWPALEDKANGEVKGEQRSPVLRRGLITWTRAQLPALAEIKPKDKGTIEILLPLRSKTELNLAKLSESKIIAYAEAIVGSPTANLPANLQSNPITLILNSDLSLSTQATLKEKKNLPTKIGQKFDNENIYTFTWTLKNSWHELTDIKLSASLPENVDWQNITSVSSGEVTFDATTKQITWTLNRLPVSVPQAVISFDLGLKFTNDDKGKDATLLDKTGVEAKDKATGENMLFWKDAITVGL